MKIVIFVSYTYPYIGSGIGHVALIQSEYLVKKGHDVVLVSSNIPKAKKRFRRKGVMHIKLSSINILDRFAIPVPFFILGKEVIREIKTADVVHCHEMMYPYSIQAAIWAKIFRRPFVLTQHAGFITYKSMFINFLQYLIKNTLGKIVVFLSDCIIVVNADVNKWLGVKNKKVFEVLNGVDTKLFHPVSPEKKKTLRRKYKLPLNKKIVLFVGRLVEKKGFHRMYQVRSKNYVVLIAGAGDVPEYMKKETEKVRFLGGLPQAKLAEIYQLSDVFVLPSDCEGFPLSIQEAMACGLPVITAKHPGFENYLDKRYVKFTKLNKKDITKAIKAVLGNNHLRKTMSKYSQEKSKLFSWDKNISHVANIYEKYRG